MSNSDPKACPKCGAILEEESIYCGSCGADLTSKSLERASDARILKHRPKEFEDDVIETQSATTTRSIGRFTPGSQESGEFDSSSFAKATFETTYSSRYSRIAIIVGILSIFVPVMGIVTFIGYLFLTRAEKMNENPNTIRTAGIILIISLIIQLLVVISTVFISFLNI